MMRLSLRAVALVAAIVAIDLVCVLPWRGNLALREISDRSALALASEPQTAAVAARENLDRLDDVARARRLDPSWYMLYAGNCEVLGRLPSAIDAYTRALRVDDRPEFYENRAMILLRLGRNEEAMADLVKAARFDPTIVEHLDGEVRARVTAAAGLK
jgi:tetratricopeptide (TPR) repeat protein